MLTSIFLGLFVGFALAVTGAGGAILSLPLLMFFLHIKVLDASPIALMAITLSAGVAAIMGLRKGLVRYKAAILLAFFGVIFAPLGVYAAHQFSENILSFLFSIILLIVAWRTFKSSQDSKIPMINHDTNIDSTKPEPACVINPATSKIFWTASCTRKLILTGSLSGFLSGLLGVGGGFIIVPALHSISNLKSQMIIATSLTVISLVSLVSALSYAWQQAIYWDIAIPFVFSTLVGMLLGRKLATKISSRMSLISFSVLSLIIAVTMFVKTVSAI